MRENVGRVDKIIRALVAVGIIVFNLAVKIHPIIALVLGVLAIVLLFTIVTGKCSLYSRLGISTAPESKSSGGGGED